GLNGWYLSDVTVRIDISGATDTTCPVVKTFRANGEALDCTATDGNVTIPLHIQFKIDKDKPTVTGATPDRAPNGNGWYSAPVNVAFSGTDATSGIASCTQASYNGPDNASAGVSGTCKDNAGNESSAGGFALKYDATAPSVNANPARGPDANGWYNHSVSVAFGGSDATSGVDSCTSGTYSGPDAESASVSGSCTDKAGNSGSESFSLKYDQTPPSVTAAPVRPPDQNGWYNRPIALAVKGTDATSKLDACSGASYTGPDKPGASLVGTCRDVAGNEASKPVEVKFDSTPPKLGKVTVSLRNGLATLRWTASPDTKAVTVLRLAKGTKKPVTVYRGNKRTFTDKKLKDGVRYSYTITGTDEAGNVATASTVADPRALWRPAAGKRLRTPPLLTWAPLAKADYYNVQLYFDGRKVLSEWPKATKLKLQRQWKFGGHRYTLEKGRYRWYVWPGFGARKASKYGKLLGGSAFVVT
ncbi:MAG TPA: hypothetical protein VH721_08480, partial [Gaiellaceae bacterium]